MTQTTPSTSRPAPPSSAPGRPAIAVQGLRKTYGEVTAVDDVSFAVEPGTVFGILGPNGAGKTTTVECIVGLTAPTGGTVDVLGHDPHADRDAVRELVGVQLQESRLPDKMRVGEAIELFATFYDDPADGDALVHRLGLDALRRRAFAKLSGGERQRLAIALALIGRPRIAVLDELTTGLDPHARREIWQLILELREGGMTVLLVTHFMDEAERLCDRVAVIQAGRVVAEGTPADLAEGTPRAARPTDGRPTLEDAYLALTATTSTAGAMA